MLNEECESFLISSKQNWRQNKSTEIVLAALGVHNSVLVSINILWEDRSNVKSFCESFQNIVILGEDGIENRVYLR